MLQPLPSYIKKFTDIALDIIPNPVNLDSVELSDCHKWILFTYCGHECQWGIGTDLFYDFSTDKEYESLSELVYDINS